MDIKKIKAIVDLVKESGIAELEITEGEEKLRICSNSQPIMVSQPFHAHAPSAHVVAPLNHETIPDTTEKATPSSAPQEGTYITSPMVGTFYRAASPENPAFVEVGQEVKQNQVLCIIEAMKLMNQIESDKAGIIKEILVKDGAAVEFGQPLFLIV